MKQHDSTADFIARSLVNLGIKRVFCLMGEANLLFIAALEKQEIEIVHGRHEQGVAAMADGYARFAGQSLPAVCTVTVGPGLTNATTSLLTAAYGRSSVLLFVGDLPTTEKTKTQLDQVTFARLLHAKAIDITNAKHVPGKLQEAMDTLATKRGVAVVNVPSDIWQQPCNPSRKLTLQTLTATASNSAEAAKAAKILAGSQRPAILAGKGAVLAGAEPEVTSLAKILGAPVATTVPANGFASDYEQTVGMAGSLGNGAGSNALHQADCVLVAGSSLSTWTTDEGTSLHNKPVIRIDRQDDGKNRPGDVLLLGDAKKLTETLHAKLSKNLRRPWFAKPQSSAPKYVDDSDGLDPRRVLAEIDRALPKKRTVILDGGQHAIFTLRHISIPSAEDFGWTSDFVAIGQGLPTAIGAAFARMPKRVTAIVGDAGFLMSVAELDTAVRHQLPLTVFVLNDQGYGQERAGLAAKHLSTRPADIPTPDIARLAQAYGAHGQLIDSPRDLSNIANYIAAAKGPIVFDIRITNKVVSDFHERVSAHKRKAQALHSTK